MPEGLKPFVAPSLASRRDVFWMAAGWGIFGWACLTSVGMLVRFLFPVASFDPKQVFRAGFTDLYPKNSVSEAFKKTNQTWIVNVEYDAKQIIAGISTVCTHLGCTPNWLSSDEKFKCPCHGSGFIITGINVEGPAPRPLERYKITLAEDGQILIDKNTKYQEEKGQWSMDGAYLPYA